jgi:hypothetical protein
VRTTAVTAAAASADTAIQPTGRNARSSVRPTSSSRDIRHTPTSQIGGDRREHRGHHADEPQLGGVQRQDGRQHAEHDQAEARKKKRSLWARVTGSRTIAFIGRIDTAMAKIGQLASYCRVNRKMTTS